MQQATFICTIALLVLSAAAQDYDYEPSQPARPARLQQSSGFSGNAGPKPTPVAILKQINRHNEDGSYTYGYEGADGSFKIETKLPGGEVKGKYGYLDDQTGKLRVVEYGANRYGFQPAGEGITVAPPTIVDETTNKDGTLNEYAESGQYYEEPAAPVARPAPRPKAQPQPQFDFGSAPRYAPAPQAPIRHASPAPPRPQIPGAQPAPVEIDYRAPARFAAPRPAPAPVHTFSPAPRPAPQRLQYAAPAPVEEDITYAEPAQRPAQIPARFAPAPQPAFRPAPQPQYAPGPGPRPAPRPAPAQGGRVGGVLDQLARDYALPQDAAAPLHDISFGYY